MACTDDKSPFVAMGSALPCAWCETPRSHAHALEVLPQTITWRLDAVMMLIATTPVFVVAPPTPCKVE